ncbi:uncharacterized protein ACO6RY_13029 [Pungitius sinensis]
MRTSTRCWFGLLAVMMLFSTPRADSLGPSIACCRSFSPRRIHVVRGCYEQRPRRGCQHAFLVTNRKGRWCVRPDAAWLREKTTTGNLRCPPDLSF